MALVLPRTPAEDAAAALLKLADLERELPNLRAHLQRVATNARQAERSADIAAELAQNVAELAQSARHLARDATRVPDCCGGTGLADYAAVPCPDPACPVVAPAGVTVAS